MVARDGTNPVKAEQLALLPEPPRLFRATPSKLAAFDCPRRYRFAYLDRPAPPRGPAWAHNAIGAVVHLALSRWWELSPARRTLDGAAGLVHRAWQHDGFADTGQSEAWREQAVKWVRDYLADPAAAGIDALLQPRGIERTVALKTATLAISGRVDRIDERDGELVIVDYKTGRSALTDEDAKTSLALALYAMATEATFRQRCRVVELHHLPSGQVLSYEHSDATFATHLRRADATAQDIQAATRAAAEADGQPAECAAENQPDQDPFPPRPNPSCSWCDFRPRCPPGQAASQTRQPWSGLGDISVT